LVPQRGFLYLYLLSFRSGRRRFADGAAEFVPFGKISVEIAFVAEIELHEVTIRLLTLLEPKRPENMDEFSELRKVVSDGWWT
jgi:hypothetical protein